MNLDELQSIRDRERQSDSLQQLRESFYADVGEFVGQLRAEREEAAARADDPFDAPEVNRLTDDIKTAEQTVEAIYERRVGKLVKMASFAAADMPTEDEGLTAEERQLFERMVRAIEENRDTVLGILDGETGDEADASATGGSPTSSREDATTAPSPDPAPDATGSPATPAEEPPGPEGTEGSVDAADLMAGSGPETAPGGTEPTGEPTEPDRNVADGPPDEIRRQADGGDPDGSETATAIPPEVPPDEPPAGEPGEADRDADRRPADGDGGGSTDRTTVRITTDVGEIFGMDERSYDLATEDVVTLPAANAEPLVERDAAERLD